MGQRHKCLKSSVTPLAASGVVNAKGQIIAIVAARLIVREGLLRIETVFDTFHSRHRNYGITVKSTNIDYVRVFSLNKM